MKTLDFYCHKNNLRWHIVVDDISYFCSSEDISNRRLFIVMKSGEEISIYPDELEKLKSWELMLIYAIEGRKDERPEGNIT